MDMATEQKQASRRQLVENARRAALDGEWDEATRLNKELLERTPRDANAFNRLGRAHLQTRDYAAASEAYLSALRIDPANMIARRNLQRLEHLSPQAANVEKPGPIIPRTSSFIEEVGKTWVDELVAPEPIERLSEVLSGEKLGLKVDGRRLVVITADGDRLGEIDPKTADRIVELIAGGNQYEVFALGLSAASLRVILRETHRDPSQASKVSFPRQIAQTRAYLRERDVLLQRGDESFLLFGEDEEELEEDEAHGLAPEEEESNDAETDEADHDLVGLDDHDETSGI
jgi:tetratricopeptide (TPR) repeat protein